MIRETATAKCYDLHRDHMRNAGASRARAQYCIIITRKVLARVPTVDTRQGDYRRTTLSINEVVHRSVLSLRLVYPRGIRYFSNILGYAFFTLP